MEKMANDKENEKLKTNVAIRCAKAAIILSSLHNSSTNSSASDSLSKKEEEIEELKIALVREKLMNKKLVVCVGMDLILICTLALVLLLICCFL